MVTLLWRLGLIFLAVAEHRLIPARVRSEWSRLRKKGLASIWAPASQDSSHVGNAGVGVVRLRGALLSLPTFATAQFKRFFDCGRAVRCVVPLGFGRFMNLVVLYGYQRAGVDAEQLALTEQLFDAALGELSVVAKGQPCLLVGDFNVEPTKLPCLANGMRVCSRHQLARGLGVLLVVIAGISWLVVLLRLLLFFLVGFKRIDIAVGGVVELRNLFSVLPFGLLFGCLLLILVGVLSLLRFKGSGKLMMSVFSLCPVRILFS